jgi:hypothetical protein
MIGFRHEFIFLLDACQWTLIDNGKASTKAA